MEKLRCPASKRLNCGMILASVSPVGAALTLATVAAYVAPAVAHLV
jgi:hypothetical protein